MSSMTGNMGPQPAMSRKGLSPSDKIPSGSRAYQMQQFTPEQLELLQRMIGQVGPESFLSRLAGGDEALFNEMEAPAMRQFAGLQGNIASRFSAGGDLGARRSSGFQNEMTAAGSNFAQDLAAKRQGLQRQAILDMSQISNMLMGQRPYDRWVENKRQKEPSGWGGMIGAGVGAAGGLLASGGNPMMGMQGAQVGYNVGSAF